MKINEILTERVYRGQLGDYTGHIMWYATDKWLAQQYAGGSAWGDKYIITKDISDDVVNKSFHHGFRDCTTDVKAEDFSDRVKRGITDAHKKGWIDKETGINLVDELEDGDPYWHGFRPVWWWWQKTSMFTDILKKAGYKAIYNLEGDFDTYGIIS